MKKLNFVGLLFCISAVSILAGCATPILKSSSRAKQYSGKNTSKNYHSGAWWIGKRASKATAWGNRGYVYLAGKMPVEKLVLQDVYFPLNSVELTFLAKKTLSSNVKALKEHPKAKVVLMGYASPEGLEIKNVKLSENRALAVKNYLVKNGVSKNSISAKGEGKMEVAKFSYPSARKVHFKIISQ